jgi:hypothetical protein
VDIRCEGMNDEIYDSGFANGDGNDCCRNVSEGSTIASRQVRQRSLAKMKGIGSVEMHGTGRIRRAEIHWYEAHGIGKVEYKIKYFLD